MWHISTMCLVNLQQKNIIIRFLKLDFIALGQITQNVQNTLQVFISLIYA